MNIGSATELARRWIYTTLATEPIVTNAVGNQIHPWPVPEDYHYPFVTHIKRGVPISGGSLNSQGGTVIVAIRYEIKVVDIGSDNTRIQPVADQIFEKFDGADDFLSGITIYGQWESDLLTDLPLDNGDPYTQLGGIYVLTFSGGA